MIRYLVSSEAQCSFCIGFNKSILMNLGKTAEELQVARENPDNAALSDPEKILLSIALASINNPQAVSSEDLQVARNKGYSDRNIFDVVAIAANNNAFTHVLRTFKIEEQGALA